jgi:PAS domain S-box-containing protein
MFANLHELSHHAAWRRQLEMLLESAGEGIYGIDLNGRCIFINSAGAELLGYTPDEVLGRNMHYLVHHSHQDRNLMPIHDCRIFRAFREGRGCRVEDEVLWRRDGSAFAAEYASYPIRDGEHVVGAVITFSDITERKRTEAALVAAHAELERRVQARTAALTDANAQLQQAHESLRRLSAHVNIVREEERAHVARDIHDELGASLTALQLELSGLRPQLAAHPALTDQVDAMVGIATKAMDSVRRILNDLRPGVLDHLGLWAALECLLQDVQRRTGIACVFDVAPEVERCRPGREAEIALYRIVQEVVTNVLRHANATRVELCAQPEVRDVLLVVRDNGCGMHVPARPSTFGLLGMAERAHAVGGELHIDSAPGAGTRVRLRLRGVLA